MTLFCASQLNLVRDLPLEKFRFAFFLRGSFVAVVQLDISKSGNGYLRRLLVQCAHFMLGPFAPDSNLRRWGLQLASHGGKNGKRRAVVAVARKLAVLLHDLWATGEVYEPLYGQVTVQAA